MLRRFPRLAIALLAFAAYAAPVPAATLQFDEIHVLGDSLSDVGNVHRLTGGIVPESPPYDRLRFSNGRIWYDRVAAAVRADGGRALNFAYGGAQARENRDPVPDLGVQRRLLLDRVDPGPGDLALIWIGGNDLLNDFGVGVARKAADQVYSNARALQRAGYDAAMVLNLPNLADIPRFLDSNPARRSAVRRASVAYNNRLADRVTSFRAGGMEVIEVNVFDLFADVTADPTAYGLENMTTPCIRNGRDRCSAAEARVTGFADTIHPSSALHAILARQVLDQLEARPRAASFRSAASAGPPVAVAAVPLPAPALLLLAAMGGLCLAGRRRVRHAVPKQS